MFQFSSSRPSSFVIRGAVFATVAGAFTLGAHAQQAAQPVAGTTAAPAPLFASLTTRPMDLATLAGVAGGCDGRRSVHSDLFRSRFSDAAAAPPPLRPSSL
jgi:hypothetical protein